MKVIIALDSFKGSCSAFDACAAVAAGIKSYDPSIETVLMPVSDGGEGLIAALQDSLEERGFHCALCEVTGPYLKKVQCTMLIKDELCVLEMAQCSGIELEEPSRLRACEATTYGLGEAVNFALSRGCRKFKIGLGGSATNDGGTGFLQALGVRFYDAKGQEIVRPMCGKDLAGLKRIDLTGMNPVLRECSFTGICDVKNPLLGKNGATQIFGPQKGLKDNDMYLLESGMENYANLLTKETGRDLRDSPGAGAAGGMGAALVWILGARLNSGIDEVLDLLELDKVLPGSSLVFVGEGRMDSQSCQGKAPAGVALRAKKQGIPVVALCGCVEEDAEALYNYGIGSMFSICNKPMTLEQSVGSCKALLKRAACNIIRLFERCGAAA